MVRSHSHILKIRRPHSSTKDSGASSSPIKFAFLSLSVADMIKLRKIGTAQGPTTVVHLHAFDMDLLSWSRPPVTVEFNEEKEPFAHGGFCNAYKAITKHPQFKGTTWVIKRYLPNAVTVEESIDGKFTKYLNNTGDCCVDETDVMGQKAQCLTHFSYEKSDKNTHAATHTRKWV